MHATPKQLAQLRLSRPKICDGHALAASTLDYDGLAHLPDEMVLLALTQITGIGRWTAEVYALQALGWADVSPYEDLALQEAKRLAFNLPGRPREKVMQDLAQAWAP
jgi:DNA-3-methyladenine glycosylase II